MKDGISSLPALAVTSWERVSLWVWALRIDLLKLLPFFPAALAASDSATDAGAAEPTGSTGHGSLSRSATGGSAIGCASYGSGSETTTGGTCSATDALAASDSAIGAASSPSP